MAKKCAPGVICIENLTLGILLVIIGIMLYIVSTITNSSPAIERDVQRIVVKPSYLGGISTRHDAFNDPYAPPLRNDGFYFRSDSSDIRGHPPIQVPVNIETRGLSTNYSQMGILTSAGEKHLILPLMGRRHMSGRDKWQYYTISNSGSLNTKLPVTVNGKSGSGEYGCDQIMNGDSIFVQGYDADFKATVYENNIFSYLPL